MPDVLIHFDENTGEFHLEAEGFEGLSCLQATQKLEQALGEVQGNERTFKPEAQIRQHTANRSQVQSTRWLNQ